MGDLPGRLLMAQAIKLDGGCFRMMARAITYPHSLVSLDGRAIKIDGGCSRVMAQAIDSADAA